jgi:hypothetical protein
MFKTRFQSRWLSFLALALVASSLLAAPYALIHAQKSKQSKQAEAGKAADTLENATIRSGKTVTVKPGFEALKISANSAGVARIGGGVVGRFECKCVAAIPGKDDADCFVEIKGSSISCKPNNCQNCDLSVGVGSAHPVKK